MLATISTPSGIPEEGAPTVGNSPTAGITDVGPRQGDSSHSEVLLSDALTEANDTQTAARLSGASAQVAPSQVHSV